MISARRAVSDPRYARSFDSVAEQYERARPEYADEAVDWPVEGLGLGPGSRVLDLAAGTGKLTRQLVGVASTSSRSSRATRCAPCSSASSRRSRRSPGRPRESRSRRWVDAVTVGQAFHWFEPETALAEMRASCARAAASRCSGTAGTRRIRSSRRSMRGSLARDPGPTVARRDRPRVRASERRTFRQATAR